jgi:hypothetical protein
LFLVALMPGLLGAFFVAAVCRWFRLGLLGLWQGWYLSVPAIVTVLLYCAVFVDKRYLAGPLVVFATIVAGSFLAQVEKRWAVDLVRIQVVVFGFIVLAPGVLYVFRLLTNATFRNSSQVDIAVELRQAGLSPGDRIAYVGDGISAYWALCDGLRIVAEVPTRFPRSDNIQRSVYLGLEEVDKFWSSDATAKAKAISSMKSSGARAVVADHIPVGADLAAWHVLRTHVLSAEGRTAIAVLFLKAGDP